MKRCGPLVAALSVAALSVAALSVAALGVAGCSSNGRSASATPTVSRNGVTVTLSYRATPGSGPDTGELIATFRPNQDGFHLYSKDLPASGISGVGYPIRAQPTQGLTSTGFSSASVDPVPLVVQSVGITLPVYPNGPVTLTEPVRRFSASATTSTVLVSYAACSSSLCLPPVVNQPVAMSLAQA